MQIKNFIQDAILNQSTFIRIHDMYLTDSEVSYLANHCKTLTKVELYIGNESWLDPLLHLPNLTDITISCCSFSAPGLLKLCQFSQLKHLTLISERNLTNDFFIEVAKLKHLVSLTIIDCEFLTDEGLKHLSKSSSLTSVTFERADTTNEGLHHLSLMKQLTSCDFAYFAIDDESAKILGTMHNLRKVRLIGCDITDTGVYSLSRLTNLTSLELYCGFRGF